MLQLTAPIILASKSPRRQELLRLMGLDFSVELKDVDESYPDTLSAPEIAVYIAEKKAKAFIGDANHIVITADTIVAINGEILGKPGTMLRRKKCLRNYQAVVTRFTLV